MSEFKVMPMSPKAQEMATAPKYQNLNIKAKYPLDDLEAGQCFTIKIEDANLRSLQAVTSRKSKNGKRFIVVKHDDRGLVEVARIT